MSRVVGTRGQLGLPTAMLLYDKGAAVCVIFISLRENKRAATTSRVQGDVTAPPGCFFSCSLACSLF